MRIDTNSWHYRLNHRFYDSNVPQRLCPYFWATVLSVSVLSWMYLIFQLIERQNFSLPTFNFGMFKFLERHSKAVVYTLYGGLIAGGLFQVLNGLPGGIVMTMVGGVGAFFYKFGNKILPAGHYNPPKLVMKKQPSIVTEYLKANHSRVCPHLEFIDMNKEDFDNKVRQLDVIRSVRTSLNEAVEKVEKSKLEKPQLKLD